MKIRRDAIEDFFQACEALHTGDRGRRGNDITVILVSPAFRTEDILVKASQED
jgi:hypothetical protein